jgi:carboxypeptidase Q
MGILTSDSISVGHVAPGNTYATDHLAFDAVGLPGYQFIQDPLDYDSRTHHSSQDVYERLQPIDLRHNAVVVATFAYLTANREELLPRKPLPSPPTARAIAASGQSGAQAVPIGCAAK